jgi:hypothetical protein
MGIEPLGSPRGTAIEAVGIKLGPLEVKVAPPAVSVGNGLGENNTDVQPGAVGEPD